MTKKTLNITEIVIYIIMLVLLWVDGTYKMIAKSVYGNYKGSTNCSFVDCAIDSTTIDNPIFPVGWIFIVLVVVSLIVLFIETLDIKIFDKRITTILSVASLITFLVISIYVDSKSGGAYEYNGDLRRSHLEMGILFYIDVILLLISVSFTILKNFIKENKIFNTAFNMFSIGRENAKDVTLSTADELKKFKDLLDSGVITQEEFDEKKKQLLGL